MRLSKFHNIIQNTPEEVKEDIRLSMDILDRLNELLNEKFEGKQHLLAKHMNKSEAEVSKWLSGVQNFTLKTIVRLQIAFQEPIIAVCSRSDDSTFTQTALPYKQGHASISIECGKLTENKTSYENIKKTGVKQQLYSREKELSA